MPAEDPHRVVCHLDDLLAARNMTLTALSQQVGVSLVNLSVLKNNRAKAIRYATLTAICSALNCSVGDLLSIAADPQATVDQNPAPDPEMAQKRAPEIR
jgi:putative transcriptional regulator